MTASGDDPAAVAAGIRTGDLRSLGRALTWVEEADPRAVSLFERLPAAEPSYRVGVTGPPGVGQSSVIARLLPELRRAGERVAVLAVDPTSPVSGGALLGDRIRMRGHEGDRDIYIRSLASRTGRGGVAACIGESADQLEQAGFGLVLVETVGTGQLEVGVVDETDLVLLLLSPESGDMIQLLKGGALEVVNLVAVNKADRPGSDELLSLVREISAEEERASPFSISAASGSGIRDLAGEVLRRRGEARGRPELGRALRRIERRLARRAEEEWLRERWRLAGGSAALAALAREVHGASLGFGAALGRLLDSGGESRERSTS